MPNSEIEWSFIYIGVGYLLSASIMTVAILGGLLRRWGRKNLKHKIISDVLISFHLIVYGISLVFVLPFALKVAESGIQDVSPNRYLLYITGLITLICVFWGLYVLQKEKSEKEK